MLKKILCTLVGIVLAAFSPHSAAAQTPGAPAGKTVWDGIYSEEQVIRGATVYLESCTSCHLANFTGGNSILIGNPFLNRFREDTLQNLYRSIATRMPRNAPGTLSPEKYLDVLTFVLSVNGFPPGAELKSDELRSIMVVGRDGPRPIPNGSLVRIYGCVAPSPTENGQWILTSASTPSRTREPDKSSDADLQMAAGDPPGTNTFQLRDAIIFKVASLVGKKVEAKGFFNQQPSLGITATALTQIAPTCQ